jgi:hypothetical protein
VKTKKGRDGGGALKAPGQVKNANIDLFIFEKTRTKKLCNFLILQNSRDTSTKRLQFISKKRNFGSFFAKTNSQL